jgi:hypothetical protein
MKKFLPLIVIAVVIAATATALFAFRSGSPDTEEKVVFASGEKVEVLYFHLTRRCVTCQAVETVSSDAVHELYAEEIKEGKVVFRSLNIEDKATEGDAGRAKATGQCLLVISGDTRIDLTSEGFMYARNKPEKLREEIKKAIDPLLKATKQN